MPKQKKTDSRNGAAAFTLIEIMVTVVILGIVALIAVPMMSGAADMQVRGAANRLAADLEYAKNMAITHQSPFTVAFDTSASSYEVYDVDSALITHPVTRGDFVVSFPDQRGLGQVRINAAGTSFDGQDEVTFDYLGTPYSGTNTTSELNSGVITLQDTTGSFALYVKVEPMTGYVTIEDSP